ncbi:RraA family protein [Pikeienuella piscinae]|uniref:Putative 4-hydroxy-4-methyl-2-oxoglutarate aldolase n=1 Tax=Pikeienuella piscinae TaxID=2748098 RepID=A0A7L5C0X6_9RHOB|nr:RraA family protein [Pikeienuella piscinae]QIE57043.1 RraA family protein [Pikeienuella piscinae]
MIEEPPVLTIRRPDRRPSATQIAAFQNTPTSFVVDAMHGSGVLLGIRPLGEGRDLHCVAAGPALTVDCGPGDILALLAALPFIKAGDIVVSAFGAHQGVAAAGDRVTGMMRNSGAAGFVTDGPMRDYAGLVRVGLPAWCAGLNPGSPVSTGPGRIGLPIQIGGREVETGDMIVADRDGVVIVPFEKLDNVIRQLETVRQLESDLDAEIEKGLKSPDAMTELLSGDGVRYVD